MSEPFSKEKIYIVEIDLPFCDLDFGTSPCTASGSGDSKCFNTLASCQSVAAYEANNSLKTYRYCEQVSPHPVGLDAVPSLSSVSIAPAQIQLDGGLGVRSSLSLTFNDHPSSDLIIDPYVKERTYDPLLRGTYWGKLRVRNPFYQNAPVRLISAYIVDGAVDLANATIYHYVLEDMNVSRGQCSITAKDPLKLADNKRAQAPKASTGELANDISVGQSPVALSPAGVGDEYPLSGYVRIANEIMSFTRNAGSDSLSVTRGVFNTEHAAHKEGDKVQLCLEYNDSLNDILEDLLVNYAGIDSSFIPSSLWAAEVSDNLSGLYTTLITEPVGVNKLIKELGEQVPHSLYWDERTQKIELTAIKPPPQQANVYSEDGELIADSVSVSDKKDLRVSTVFVYYGQINPTEKLDEESNYSGTYVRANLDSINRYGSNSIKTIYSRWITRDNKAAALRLAAKIGRRFGTTPRAISFELDPKFKNVWAGQVVGINHRYLPDFTGSPNNVLFQLITAQETDNYKYTGIEYNYDPALPEDEGGGDDGVTLLFIEGERLNYNIRDAYENIAGTPDADTIVKVIVESTAIAGSSTTSGFAIETGTFPTGATITIENRNFIVGAGGDGATATENATNGGVALRLQHPITLNNLGVIGGGGGGGGAGQGVFASDVYSGGGGGAGFNNGLRGIGVGGDSLVTQSTNGTVDAGGVGERRDVFTAGESEEVFGGNGGGLGQNGASSTSTTGGLAGAAIITNGNTITYENAGDIRGSVS